MHRSYNRTKGKSKNRWFLAAFFSIFLSLVKEREPPESIFGHKECGAEMYPPVTASPCQPPLGKGAIRTGVRIATTSLRTGLAMTHYKECGALSAGGQRRPPLRVHYWWCVGEGLCPSRRARQYPSVGWHDGGQEKPAPTGGLQEVRWGEESPSHGFAVPAPFRQGGQGDGGTDCHTSDIGHWFAMTGFFARSRYGGPM